MEKNINEGSVKKAAYSFEDMILDLGYIHIGKRHLVLKSDLLPLIKKNCSCQKVLKNTS